MEISVQEILIAVKGLAIMDISPSSHLGQKAVFSHNTEDRLGVMVDSLPLQPDVDAAVSISFSAGSLAFADLLCKRQISCRRIHPLNKIIVSASGYLKEAAHRRNGILIFVSLDDTILHAGPHFLSVSERKSRSSSFSI